MPINLSIPAIRDLCVTYGFKMPTINSALLNGISYDTFKAYWNANGHSTKTNPNGYHITRHAALGTEDGNFTWCWGLRQDGDQNQLRVLLASHLLVHQTKSPSEMAKMLLMDAKVMDLTYKEIRCALASISAVLAESHRNTGAPFEFCIGNIARVLFFDQLFMKAVFKVPLEFHLEISLLQQIVFDADFSKLLVEYKGKPDNVECSSIEVGRKWEAVTLDLPTTFLLPSVHSLDMSPSTDVSPGTLPVNAIVKNTSLLEMEEHSEIFSSNSTWTLDFTQGNPSCCVSRSSSMTSISPPENEQNYNIEVICKHPNLELAQLRFLANHPETNKASKETYLDQLQAAVKELDMAPLYELLCTELGVTPDATQLSSMKASNDKKIKEIESEIDDAEKNLGGSEVRQAWLRKFEHFCQIGDKENACKTFTSTYEKTVGMGYRIDLVFTMIRVGLFFLDHTLINQYITKAKELMEQGGDWEREGRLRSYEALYKMSVRDFNGAAALFLDAVPTFGSHDMITYEKLVFYTVITNIFALDRPDICAKLIKSNEIQEQLCGGGLNGALVPVREYLKAFYGCHYERFFIQLASLEAGHFKFDRYLSLHFNFYSRAMRLRAYEQFLSPYKTVRVDMMASDFGVSRSFIDKELYRLIATGQLHCRIDAVRGVIEMNHPDSKNHQYKSVIKDGDALLNRIKNLAGLINV